MMRPITRKKLAQEVANWRHDDLIDGDTAALLEERYAISATLGAVFVRWLGFFALFLLGSSLLALIGLAMGEFVEVLAPFAVGALSAAMVQQGVRFATDPQNRYPTSGSVLITAGLIGALGTLLLFFNLVGGEEPGEVLPLLLALVAAGAVALAYRFGLRWPLGLGALMAFHAAGMGHAYGGRGSYFLGIQDPRLMAVLALAVIGAGLWHEADVERRSPRLTGLGSIYLIFGLLYANLSLWILSIRPGSLDWVIVFTVAGIVQIAVGAARGDGRLTGFGAVFLGINLYTRYFEHFWDDLSRGAFFLLGGVAALVFAGICERQRPGGET